MNCVALTECWLTVMSVSMCVDLKDLADWTGWYECVNCPEWLDRACWECLIILDRSDLLNRSCVCEYVQICLCVC